MKKFLAITLSALYTQMSFADCTELYAHKISEISGKMNAPRTTVLVNAGAEAVLIGTLAAIGAVTVSGVIALPAVAVGAGGYLAVLSQQKKSYIKSLLTLRQAEGAEGPIFKKFVRAVQKKNSNANKVSIQQMVLRLNSEKLFCSESARTGKLKVLGFKKMAKLVAREI